MPNVEQIKYKLLIPHTSHLYLCLLQGHTAEIISLSFNATGTHLITGSFDNTVMVWDVNTGKRVYTLVGHQAEISSAQFNFDCSLIATGSMDKTCKLWDFTRGEGFYWSCAHY